ncbi:hypothetical protein VTH82DRAFT_3536 [Thermothelomyces myriococcoides]
MRLNNLVWLPLCALAAGANTNPSIPKRNPQYQHPSQEVLSDWHNPHPQGGKRPGSGGDGSEGGLEGEGGGGVSAALFSSLERTSRLVDITYCVGTAGTGIMPPFSCLSRCKDFPSVRLVRTWNTGMLLSDSCGYIAVDHGHGHSHERRTPSSEKEKEEVVVVPVVAGDRGGTKEIIVAFRGTYSLTNTIVDLSTVPQEYVPYPAPPEDGDGDGNDGGSGKKCHNCTVHMGFMASWRNAREVVIPALKAAREQYPGYRVHLIGHSLGGAVAALAALELRVGLGWQDVVVTTFGEPRVGNAELADYINWAFGLGDDGSANEDLVYRRVTHAGDPVPQLPLSEWGYRPHAGEIYISKSDLPPAPEDLRLCHGNNDPRCLSEDETPDWLSWLFGRTRSGRVQGEAEALSSGLSRWLPTRFQLWQLLFAHRDYFWRLGLCVPGGDPTDWGKDRYNVTVDGDQDEMQDL